MNSYHVTCRELEIQRQSRRRISSLKHVVFCFKDLRASLCGLVDADRSTEFAETKANDSSITRHQRSLLTSLRGRKATLKTDSAKAIGRISDRPHRHGLQCVAGTRGRTGKPLLAFLEAERWGR